MGGGGGGRGGGLARTGSRLPVTAVAFLGEGVVLAGSGGELTAYSVATQAEEWRVEVFSGARIHGIAVDGERAVVYGSKSWAVVSGGRVEFACEEDDWIKAAQWIGGDIALVLAHNRLRVCSADSGRTVHEARCEEPCILYAAAVWGDSLDSLAVAAGTVFNQVLVWRRDGRVVHRLRGHAGVVFGVAFSADGAALASVSDDRSVRVWALPPAADRPPLALYGHRTRVWRCAVAGGLLVTAGEDGTVRVWDRGCAGQPVATWRQCKKNVWALAATPTLAATGASDGSVRLWALADARRRCVEDTALLDAIQLPPPASYLPEPAAAAGAPRAAEHIRGFALPAWDAAVVAVDSGCLLARGAAGSWSAPLHVPGLAGYAVVADCGAGRVAVGMRDGTVLLVRADAGRAPAVVASARLHTHAVQQLHCAREMAVGPGAGACDLITVDAGGAVLWTRLGPAGDGLAWDVRAALAVPGAARVATAAVSAVLGWAALGSVNGGLYLYDLPPHLPGCPAAAYDPAAGCAAVPLLAPAAQWLQAHGKHTLAALDFEPPPAAPTAPGPRDCALLTGGRDGQMHRFAISVAAEPAAAAGTASRCGTTANAGAGARAVCVRRVASTRLTNGWVAQLVRHGGRLYAVSFYNKRLVVTDVARDNAVLLSVACSGGTKPFRVQFGAPGLRVAFLHHGRLWAYALDHTAAECGLSLADAAISPLDMRAVAAATTPAGVTVVATAGEDGCLRIHRGPPSLAVVAASRRHRSAIKCAAFVPPAPADPALYLLTAGAACELRCWEVDVSAGSGCHTATVVEYAVAATADDVGADSPDLRIMDLAVVVRTGGSVFVAAAYSDSSLVLWRLDMCSRQLDRVAATRTHGCLFSTAVLSHADAAFVLAGTSAGAIVAWDVSRYLADRPPPPQPPHESEPAALLPAAHQSGVNSICVHALDGARFLVASGGDDGLVSASEVAIADGAPARVRTAAATVHASAVQGVGFAGDGPALVSVSTDQRLALWDLRALPDALELALRHMVLTQVADPSALHLSPAPAGHIALVAGMGLEAFEL